MLKRFKLGLVAILVVVLSVAGGAPATAKKKGDDKKGKAEIEYNCKKSKVKPQHIEVGCNKKESRADLRRVEYRDRDYGDKRVRGKGDLSVPGAADNPYKASLRFKRLRNCHGKENYRQVTVRFRGSPPAGWDRSEQYRLDC